MGVVVGRGAGVRAVAVGASTVVPLLALESRDALPFRDAFAVPFFVSVGMLFDRSIVVRQPLQIVSVLAIILVGKSLAARLLLAFRYPFGTALVVAASLATGSPPTWRTWPPARCNSTTRTPDGGPQPDPLRQPDRPSAGPVGR